jgi:menaquinone-specific isochorismate synthase
LPDFFVLMQIIPSEMLPNRDEAALYQFLEGCRDTARAKGHYQIASISLAVRHIAPLAVLQSIYEPEELHFYVERASDGESLAGAEAVVQESFAGADRFQAVKRFAEEVLAHTIAVGDLSEPFAGPHFFTAFSFAECVPAASPFPSVTVFLPRWQVSRSRGKYGAVANLRIDPDTDLDAAVARLWGAYQKFDAFEYDVADVPEPEEQPQVVHRQALAPKPYGAAVEAALKQIQAGQYEKIVLARGIQLEADRNWEPLAALNRLREKFSGCYCFSFGGGGGRSFIGATPERLLRIHKGALHTEAIAGSAPRGLTAGEDARLGRALLDSEKDQHEHRCVCDSILRRLRQLGIEGRTAGSAQLLPLANVQHLHTPIRAEVGEQVHLLDLADLLHPTPAVGGTPRDAALLDIPMLEEMDRGLYAGLVGWFNHLNDGEMVVGIRSALIEGDKASLYAGAGIVEGSEPERETRETELKLRALLGVLAANEAI